MAPKKSAGTAGGGRKSEVRRNLDSVDVPIAEMKSGRRQRIGWGEFEPADGSRAVEYLRFAFLERLRSREMSEAEQRVRADGPRKLRVLKELAGDPLREFVRAGLTEEEGRRLAVAPAGDFGAGRRPLEGALRGWARRWHLEAPWCLTAALDTLSGWAHDPRMLELQLWGHNFPLDESSRKWTAEVDRTAPFEGLPPFFAHVEIRPSYLKRMRKRIGRRLRDYPHTARLGPALRREVLRANMEIVDEYCDRVERLYERQRGVGGARLWRRVKLSPDLARDLDLAVEVQVRGRSASDVARKEEIQRQLAGGEQGVPASSVTRRVRETLQTIGLPARADFRPGRPSAAGKNRKARGGGGAKR